MRINSIMLLASFSSMGTIQAQDQWIPGTYRFLGKLGAKVHVQVETKSGVEVVNMTESSPLLIKGRVRIHDDGLSDFLVCSIDMNGKKISATFKGPKLIAKSGIDLSKTIRLKANNVKGKAVVNILGRHHATLNGSMSVSMKLPMTDLSTLPKTIKVTSVRLTSKQIVAGLPKILRAKVAVSQSSSTGTFEILRYANFDCK